MVFIFVTSCVVCVNNIYLIRLVSFVHQRKRKQCIVSAVGIRSHRRHKIQDRTGQEIKQEDVFFVSPFVGFLACMYLCRRFM